MRAILYPNGAILNNSLDVNLTPGTNMTVDLYIPGYVAGSFSLITDLQYDFEVVDDTVHANIYVPPTYGASGPTTLVATYGTVSIYGNLIYNYDILTDTSSRSVSITNSSGTPFKAEIGIAEGEDIYTATEVDYGIVGNLTVESGTKVYPLESDVVIVVLYNIFPQTMTVNIVVDITAGGQEPLPGTLVISSDQTSIEIPIVSGSTIINIPESGVSIIQVSNTNEYVIVVSMTAPVRVVVDGTPSLTIGVRGDIVPYQQGQGFITFLASPGLYLLK
jgi:hypothetical protein